MGGGEAFACRENMISALLVKEDFVLMTASSKAPLAQRSIERPGSGRKPD
jgi:hypothetical protein